MPIYTDIEKKSIYSTIENIKNKKSLNDIHQTISNEYSELLTSLESINNKFNYLLAAVSIIFSFTVVLLPILYQPNCIAKDKISLFLGVLFSIGFILLVSSVLVLLLKFKAYNEYRKLDESKLIDLGEYYPKFYQYLREKIKALILIVNYNHSMLEKRKKELRNICIPMIIALVLVFLTSPVMIYRADDYQYINSIITAIYSLNP